MCQGSVPLIEGEEWMPWELHCCWPHRCQRWKFLFEEDLTGCQQRVLDAARQHGAPVSVHVIGLTGVETIVVPHRPPHPPLTQWGLWPVVTGVIVLLSISIMVLSMI